MNRYVTTGLTVLAGAALFEAALIPGLVIGGVAVLAPAAMPALRRRLQPLVDAAVKPRATAKSGAARRNGKAAPAAPAKLGIGRAVAKTITFRIIVTTLDFSSNFIVLGEAGTAAGLSAFALVVGPLFYLAHETAWNYFGPEGTAIDLPALRPNAKTPPAGRQGFTISRALAKTITFRTLATAMDFTTIYVVVGDLATAAGLSAFGFVVGPFVYYGHEWAWDRYGWAETAAPDLPPPMKLLPAPG